MRDRVRQGLATVLPLWVLVTLLFVGGSLGGLSLDRAVAQGLITLVMVVGLGIFVSNSGVLSFGHMAFAAVGAYTTAIFTLSATQKQIQLGDLPEGIAGMSLDPNVAVLVGGLLAVLFAFFLAVPLMRLSGLTAALATFAVLIVTRVVIQNLDTYTRGTRGLILDVDSPPSWVLLLIALGGIALAVFFSQSQVGLRLIASREDEHAARSIGIRVWWERGLAWVLSAFVVAVGGALFAWQFQSINPDSFYISYTFIVVAMLVVGGMNTVTGAVLGSVVISVGVEILRAIENGVTLGPIDIPARPGLSELGLALILLVTLLFRPSGLVGETEPRFADWMRLVRRQRRESQPEVTSTAGTDVPGGTTADDKPQTREERGER